MAAIRLLVWWLIKIVCGLLTAMGALLVIFGIAHLIPLLLGLVQPDHDIPPVSGAFVILVFGLVQMIVGFKVPAWFDIDRLL